MRHIYLCECNSKIFVAWTYSSHPWVWPAYVKSQFAFTRTVEIKGLCLQLKRSGTEYGAQKINFFNINSCKWPSISPLKKVSHGSDKLLMSYYLFIFLSHQHVQHMTSQTLLILIDFFATFWSEITFFLNLYNFGTRRYINPIPHGVFWITHTWGGADSARPLVTQPF